MDTMVATKRLPTSAVLASVVAAVGVAILMLVTSTAVAASEAVLFEWILSASLIGVLAHLAAGRFTRQGGLKVVAGIGSAVVYLAVRMTLAILVAVP